MSETNKDIAVSFYKAVTEGLMHVHLADIATLRQRSTKKNKVNNKIHLTKN